MLVDRLFGGLPVARAERDQPGEELLREGMRVSHGSGGQAWHACGRREPKDPRSITRPDVGCGRERDVRAAGHAIRHCGRDEDLAGSGIVLCQRLDRIGVASVEAAADVVELAVVHRHAYSDRARLGDARLRFGDRTEQEFRRHVPGVIHLGVVRDPDADGDTANRGAHGMNHRLRRGNQLEHVEQVPSLDHAAQPRRIGRDDRSLDAKAVQQCARGLDILCPCGPGLQERERERAGDVLGEVGERGDHARQGHGQASSSERTGITVLKRGGGAMPGPNGRVAGRLNRFEN